MRPQEGSFSQPTFWFKESYHIHNHGPFRAGWPPLATCFFDQLVLEDLGRKGNASPVVTLAELQKYVFLRLAGTFKWPAVPGREEKPECSRNPTCKSCIEIPGSVGPNHIGSPLDISEYRTNLSTMTAREGSRLSRTKNVGLPANFIQSIHDFETMGDRGRVSQNQNQVLKWSTRSPEKNQKGGNPHPFTARGCSLANLHLPESVLRTWLNCLSWLPNRPQLPLSSLSNRQKASKI